MFPSGNGLWKFEVTVLFAEKPCLKFLTPGCLLHRALPTGDTANCPLPAPPRPSAGCAPPSPGVHAHACRAPTCARFPGLDSSPSLSSDTAPGSPSPLLYPHPTPSAPLGGTCVSSLADCQKFPSTLWAGDRFFKNCFPLFSVSLPYLLLPSFPLFSFDCSLFPLQLHCLASPLARFPSPYMFALLKSFKDVSGILAHSPHSAERGTLR